MLYTIRTFRADLSREETQFPIVPANAETHLHVIHFSKIVSPPLNNASNGGYSSNLAIRLLVQVHAVHRQRTADAHSFSGTSGTPFQCNVFRRWLPYSLK